MDREQSRRKSCLGVLLPFGISAYRERSLAIFRLVAALAFIAAFPLVRELAGDYAYAVGLILTTYALFSLVVLAMLTISGVCSGQLLAVIQIADLFWPALLCLFTGCSRSPFLFLFAFGLLAVSYRRKAIDTMLAGVLSIFIVSAEAAVVRLPMLAALHLVHEPIQWASFSVKATVFLALDAILAYSASWTEREQQAIAAQIILRRLSSDAGMESNLREILPALMEIFEAKGVVLVLRSLTSWRVVQWGTGGALKRPTVRGVSASEEEQYFFPMPVTGWSTACSRRGSKDEWTAIDREGGRIDIEDGAMRSRFGWNEPFRTLLVTTLQFGSEWSGRLFLVDSSCAPGVESSLRLLQRLADEVCPAVYNRYLWQQTGARVRAIERRRVARDLHDGAIQSLIATDLQIELLRRQTEHSGEEAQAGAALIAAQEAIQGEVRKLREQIELLRARAPERQVLPILMEMLETFQKETGISTSFEGSVGEEQLPRRISCEILRIVEEALSNIRRHSGARKVEVRLTGSPDAWEVVIQDDGRGFDFSGRLSLAQMEATGQGPRAIRERVYSANGDLVVESHPNRGASLKIRFANV